jgi:hypothetical protein
MLGSWTFMSLDWDRDKKSKIGVVILVRGLRRIKYFSLIETSTGCHYNIIYSPPSIQDAAPTFRHQDAYAAIHQIYCSTIVYFNC